MSTTTIHKMNDQFGATCGAESYDNAVSWSNVNCAACRAELAKVEIKDDAAAGLFPADVICEFADLHDFVDANEYGGLCDERLMVDDEFPEAVTDMANEVQHLVSEWIKAGGLTK